MEHYPDTLPLPILADGAYQQVENLLTDEMGGGVIKSRVRWLGEVPVIKECTWRFRRSQAALFEGWIEHFLQRAIQPFEMVVATPMGHLPHICKLLTDPRQQRQVRSVMVWEYRATVMIRQFATMDEAATVAAYLEGIDIVDLVSRLRAATLDYLE